MKHLLNDIAELHQAFDHPVRPRRIHPGPMNAESSVELQKRLMMRLRLVAEEFVELLEGALGVTTNSTLPEDVGLSIAVEADDGCTVEETKGVGETPEYFNKIEAFGEIMEDAVGALGGRSVGGGGDQGGGAAVDPGAEGP